VKVITTWLVLFVGVLVLVGCQGKEKVEVEVSKPLPKKEASAVYIYHTHNQESFLPHLTTDRISEVQDPEKNIVLVGKNLKEDLESKNINVILDTTDISKILKEKNLSYNQSYNISGENLKKIIEDKDISIALDIHRDSLPKEETTVKIDGRDYAKVVFYVSKANKTYYDQSLNLANTLHDELEKMNPGLSRGVIIKDSTNTYNQDIFPSLAVIGVGGPQNTLEEEYRTIEKIAEVIQKNGMSTLN
jgi:stage II sporulation protein P